MTHTPTPHPSNVSARPLNPDTGLPMPSPSSAQVALAEELTERLLDLDLDGSQGVDAVIELLREGIVRQHGRTTRAHLAEMRGNADSFDRDARAMLTNAQPEGAALDLRQLTSAQQLATAAATLRTTMLRGYSA